MEHLVIFSDLDGSLLDFDSYLAESAQDSLRQLQQAGIPVVFVTAKTQAEVLYHQDVLGIHDPFIVENGSAIFIPTNYFSIEYPFQRQTAQHRAIELGVDYQTIQQRLQQIRQETAVSLRGFGEMSDAEVAELTGLDLAAATRAKTREYDETVIVKGETAVIQQFQQAVAAKGLQCTHGGRFFHVLGPTDKGKAVRHLARLFRQQIGPLYTAAIGDGLNDLPMLAVVDIPVLLGSQITADLPRLHHIPIAGPSGWQQAIQHILATTKTHLPARHK